MSHCPHTQRAAPDDGLGRAEGGNAVPMIEVKLYDRRVTEESVPKMIEALTNALAESSGAAPEHIQVVGIAGKQQS
jgi:hypothetical protein